MKRTSQRILCRNGLSVLGIVLTAGGAMAFGQTAELPSSPTPNPSSLANPFYGSVTIHPATNEVMRLSLDEAVQQGLSTNLGLKNAEEDEKSFRGQVTQAVQLFLPSITVTGATGYNEFNLAAFGFGPSILQKFNGLFPGGLPSGLSFITKADVTTGQVNYEETFFSGPYIDGYRAVRAAEKASFYAKQSARGEVVQQVATAYLAVIADQAQVENAKALLDADKVLLDEAHEKHLAGVFANLDELRPRVQYQQQQQVVLADEVKREKDEILLKREIGIAPGQKILLTDPAPYSELVSRSVEDLRAEAYANRQDYQNLQSQQREASLAVRARKAERLPTLSFKGNYGVTEVSGIGSHGTLSAIGTLSVPIFKEATLRGDTDVARAQLHSVDLQLADLTDHIDQQVRSALLDVHATQELVDVARSNVDLASRALSDETDRYRAGVDDTLPLTRAQATLQSAQSNLVQSLYQLNVAKLVLARSTGLLEQKYKVYLGN